MTEKCYVFNVGSFNCAALADGGSVIGADGILKRFTQASEADCRQAYADVGLSLDEAYSALNILLVKIGGDTILIDAGEAGKPRGGDLPASLRLAGADPAAVTRVIITHTHGDHVQGLLTADGQPTYPNAAYIISRTELAFWQQRIEERAPDQRPIVTMMQARGLRLIDMDEQIIPGVTAVPIPGHTPGQIAVMFESGGQKLIHLADMLHSPMQFAHPEWSPTFDADTSQSVPTRRRLLERAADENALVMFYHLPFPGLGRVLRAGGAFVWEPLAASV